MAYALPTVLTC